MVFLLEKQKNLNDYIFKKAEAEIKSTKYEEDIFDLKNKNINELTRKFRDKEKLYLEE